MAYIRRKRKGTSYYYELVEAVWEEGKPKQRIIEYFPSLEAANLYCEKKGIRKFETKYLFSPELEKRLEEKLARLNKARPLPETALKNLKEKFEIDMTYNSNAIEGNRLTLRETWLVIRKGITIGGKSLEEHLEAKNHVEALHFLYALVDLKKTISGQDLLELHRLILDKIYPEFAGRYRTMQVYIEGSAHVPPPAKEVPRLMEGVIRELGSKDQKTKAVISASKVHYLLTKIHPFADGNGRLARLLLNLRLMRSGFPPTILRKTERRAYYAALEKADDGDLYPITTLIANDVVRALDLYLSVIT